MVQKANEASTSEWRLVQSRAPLSRCASSAPEDRKSVWSVWPVDVDVDVDVVAAIGKTSKHGHN